LPDPAKVPCANTFHQNSTDLVVSTRLVTTMSHSENRPFTSCSRVTDVLIFAEHSREPPARARWIGP
jgi:hypothetical protein